MKDSIPLGNGNSRYLKSVANFKTLYPTYDAFVNALVEGTLPIDFNGINHAGWAQLGDAINKNTFLKDATAALFGLSADAVPDDIYHAVKEVMDEFGEKLAAGTKIATGIYDGTGAYGAENPNKLTFDFEPYFLMVSSATTTSTYSFKPNNGFWSNGFIWNKGMNRTTTGASRDSIFTATAKTLEWYATQNSAEQMNISGVSYGYVAIGI